MKRIACCIMAAIMALSLFGWTSPILYSQEVQAAVQDTILDISDAKVRPGEEFTVAVNLANNPGIAFLNFAIQYDHEKLRLTGFTNSGWSGWTVGIGQKEKAVWASEDVSDFNGEILTLRFQALEAAQEGTTEIVFNGLSAYDIDDEISVTVNTGIVTIFNRLPGDANDDGKLDGRDLVRLKQYFAGYNVTINELNADVNNNGSVDGRDVIRMCQYFAGYEVVLEPEGESQHTHVLAENASVSATCTKSGNIAYWYCTGCKKYYADANATREITLADTVVEAKGHTPVADPAVPATYDSTGLTEGSHCGVCGVVIVPQETTPILIRVPSYNVTFYDSDGTSVLANRTEVPEGGYAQPPVNPSKNGASFLGWSGKYANITEDGSVQAVYSDEKNVFMVSSASGSRNNAVSVLVSLDGAVKTCGFDLNILYDEGLELISVDDDLDLDVIANTEAIENGIILNFSSTSDKTKQRDIIELTFRIKDSAASSLPVNITINSVKELVDGRIANADYSTVCGVIQVNG